MAWCLIPQKAEDFIAKLKDGTIDPSKLSEMTSEERHQFLGDVVGKENAQQVNALFESKLLLKNQQQGMVTWAKRVAGLNKTARGDLIAKIEKLDTVLSPKDEQGFLKDLVDTKLGVNVTKEEATHIMDLTKNIETASHDINSKGISDFGRATFELNKFLDVKTPMKKGQLLANISSVQRALQTGFDVSAIGRQGGTYFGRSEWFGAVKRMVGYIKSQDNLDELAMKMYSDKNWDIIAKYKKDLGLTNLGEKMTEKEEAFASKLIDSIPGLSHSERAYTGFLSDLRYHRFTNTINTLTKRGIELDDKALKGLAEVIAGGTGRGYLPGTLKTAGGALSQTLFSPRWFASRLQLLTNPILKSGPARTEAIKSLATVAGLATSFILGAKATGAQVETDPRSSDFGKMKVGNTRYDLTFGQGQYVRALVQTVTGTTKSQDGSIKQLNTGEWGSRSSYDVLSDFLTGKAAPNVSALIDFLKHQDRDGNKLGIDWNNLKGEKNINSAARVLNMFLPLVGSDAIDAFSEGAGNTADSIKKGLTSLLMSDIGLGVQTYGGGNKDIIKNLGIDERSMPEKLLNLPVRTNSSYKPLLDKMVKENISVSVPASSTTIKPKGAKESRPMTKQELDTYQGIYQKNLKSDLIKNQNSILSLTGKSLEKKVDKIKTETTDKSKIELLKGMTR